MLKLWIVYLTRLHRRARVTPFLCARIFLNIYHINWQFKILPNSSIIDFAWKLKIFCRNATKIIKQLQKEDWRTSIIGGMSARIVNIKSPFGAMNECIRTCIDTLGTAEHIWWITAFCPHKYKLAFSACCSQPLSTSPSKNCLTKSLRTSFAEIQ